MARSKTPETTIRSVISSPSLLDALENESIEIFRETAAAFRTPVMLYSISKDSSVLHLHSAQGLRSSAHTFVTTMEEVVQEVTELKLSERVDRLIDGEKEDSMEKNMTEGYF